MHRNHSSLCGLLIALLLSVAYGPPVCAQTVAGRWVGMAETSTERTRIVLDIQPSDDGYSASMSLPDIGVTGWPAQSARLDGQEVRITFPSDSGPQVMQIVVEDDSAAGTWQEARFEEPALMQLTRAVRDESVAEERVYVEGPAGRLGVSFFIPDCETSCPGVVFLHGSGPQPRDSNRFAAQVLAEHGVASAIFDKRGVGESTGSLTGASFDDLARDALAVAEALRDRSGVNGVGYFGHSQGGWIAPLAAVLSGDAAFVISSAGPAVPPSREAEWDTVRRLRLNGYGRAAEAAARQTVRYWHQGVRSNDWTSFDAAVDSAAASKWFQDADFSVFMSRPGQSYIRSYQAIMDFDPVPVLQELDVPLLAILAPEDESIDAMETAGILLDLADEGLDLTLRLYPGYDHSIRRLGTPESAVRWPEQPVEYHRMQADFIKRSTR